MTLNKIKIRQQDRMGNRISNLDRRRQEGSHGGDLVPNSTYKEAHRPNWVSCELGSELMGLGWTSQGGPSTLDNCQILQVVAKP